MYLIHRRTNRNNRGVKCSVIITDASVASVMSILHEMTAASGSKENHLHVVDIDINLLIFNKTSDADSMKSRSVKNLTF